MWLLLDTSTQSYMGSPMIPFDSTFSDPKGLSQGRSLKAYISYMAVDTPFYY